MPLNGEFCVGGKNRFLQDVMNGDESRFNNEEQYQLSFVLAHNFPCSFNAWFRCAVGVTWNHLLHFTTEDVKNHILK